MALFSDIRPNARRSYPALNLLRLAAASAVFVSHVWRYTGRIENWNEFLGRLGVDIFFIISGFLIAKSWESRNSTVQYAFNRAFRIFPALIVVVVFSAFVIGPLFTSLPLHEYLSASGTYCYLLNGVLDMRESLPGVFTQNPNNDHVNGSLWTLPYEAGLYVILAAIGLMSRKTFRFIVAAIYLLLLTLNLVDAANWYGADHYATALSALEFATYFFAGSVVWVFRRGFVLRWYLALAGLVVLTFREEIGCDGMIWFIALPYAVLWLGLRDLPQWRWLQHPERNDYSYGLYIWGTPIQQSVVALIGPKSLIANFLVAAVPVSLAACGSWHLVEKRCLALKSRLHIATPWTNPVLEAATEPV